MSNSLNGFNELMARSAARKPRLGLGVSLLCALGLLMGAAPAQAQLAEDTGLTQSTTDKLMPLTARQMGLPSEPVGLEQVSDTFNAQMESDRQDKAEGLQLDTLPIIGDLVDESGHLNMGVDLPFEMSISDVMGETGLVLSTDFTVD